MAMVLASGVVTEATWVRGGAVIIHHNRIEDGRRGLTHAVILEIFLQKIYRILHFDGHGVHNFFCFR